MKGKHKEADAGSWLGGVWRALAPMAVATAIALTFAGWVDLVHAHQRADKKERAAKPAAAEGGRSVPPHLVGIRKNGSALVVRDVRTGNEVGVPVAAPAGHRFERVAATRDGGYVVSSYAARKVTFQRLRLEKSGRPKELTDIPRAVVPGMSAPWSDMAVSPDGSRIAYVTYTGMKGRVEVVSARTGQRKAWKAPAPARVGSLSWAGDNLAFLWSPLRKVNGKTTEVRPQLRVLDTKGRGGDLRASRPLLKLPDGAEAAITSLDGRTVVTGVFANGQVSLQTYSAQTGRPAKVLWRQPVEGGKMPRLTRIARDHTGDHLIALDADGRLFVEGGRPLDAPDLGDVAW